MKIALVDNMNNNFFAFARYLRDLGLDVYLYTIPQTSMDHFLPEADTFKDIKSLSYIKSFPCSMKKGWLFFPKRKIKQEFESYDFIISSGVSSAFLNKAGLVSDIIMPYGSDLYDIPFRKFKLSFSIYKMIRGYFESERSYHQRQAYYKTRLLSSDDGYEIFFEALKKLNLKSNNFGCPMLYNREGINTKENIQLWSFLGQYDFIVFNHARQHWKSYNVGLKDFEKFGGLKANNKLIKAFANFVKVSKYKKPILILFEYGNDVDESKELIEILGVKDFVKWMPKMNRRNILYGLSKANLATNAFRENMLDIGGVCFEAISVGVPLINNCQDSNNNQNHKFYNSPMIHALSEEDIFNIFIDYEINPKKYEEIGKKSKEWFDDHLGIGLAKQYSELIHLMVEDKEVTQNDDRVLKIFKK